MDDRPQAKRLGAQESLPGQREQPAIAWHGITACYSAGATGSVWHRTDNGYTDFYSSQDSTNSVKMHLKELDGGFFFFSFSF